MHAEDASELSIAEGEGIVVYNGFGVSKEEQNSSISRAATRSPLS